jgi:hypothetical protein
MMSHFVASLASQPVCSPVCVLFAITTAIVRIREPRILWISYNDCPYIIRYFRGVGIHHFRTKLYILNIYIHITRVCV